MSSSNAQNFQQKRNRIFEDLKCKHIKPNISGNPQGMIPQENSPFLLSSGLVTGSNSPAPIIPNQNLIFTSINVDSQEIPGNSFGYYVHQDSFHNPWLPCLPRF
ncbi:hypothetical protein SSS_08444 [Sarcoptes scabiei]|uniref:Uncharacterized protein n=1 Tax=Sarcoptes scabiei TaxID=52283 RepID=A0A834R795_SARSC|nr:hypothetical protein SSS_08444 [Sarcoptes scabiei]